MYNSAIKRILNDSSTQFNVSETENSYTGMHYFLQQITHG